MLTITPEYFATPKLTLEHTPESREILEVEGYDNLVHYYTPRTHTFINHEGNEEVGFLPWSVGEKILNYIDGYYHEKLIDYANHLEIYLGKTALANYQSPEEMSFPSQKGYAVEHEAGKRTDPLLKAIAEIKKIPVDVVVENILVKGKGLEAMGALNGNIKREVLDEASRIPLDYQGYLDYQEHLQNKLYRTPQEALEVLSDETV